MYTGHAAIAIFAKSKRPRLAIALLVPVAWAPDWIEWVFAQLGHHNRMLSHSLIAVGIGATLVALLYGAATRAAGDALVLWLTYASHWPADFITGLKPTWPGGPMVGLRLYMHPAADFLLESTLVILAVTAYLRSLPSAEERQQPILLKQRQLMVLLPLGLIALQLGFEFLNGQMGFA